jgi:phosphomannomutase
MQDLSVIKDEKIRKKISSWLDGNYDEKTKEEIRYLLDNNPQELINAFYKDLDFGTGGMRGIMGAGTNRLNIYTIRSATQALANYLKSQKKEKAKIVIGYDTRTNSYKFAQEAAMVLAANQMTVFLFKETRPVPLISFTCRYKKANAAIMITASHNPSEYNGYKVYWEDGAQVLPPHDIGIINEVNKIDDPTKIKTTALSNPLIEYLDEEMDVEYIKKARSLSLFPEYNKEKGKELSVIYTNLHGAGITLLPKTFLDWGFSNISFVEKQKSLDGNFPFAKKPNPEEKESLQLGMDLLKDKKADILIATDPDADRMAAVIMAKEKPLILTGNQIAVILLYHICESLSQQEKLNENAGFIKSIVTTLLFDKIVNSYNKSCFSVLTGFKYIGQLINSWDTSTNGYHFLFGAEESYGYLANTFVRDKDAISSACLLAEATLKAKKQKKTLYDELLTIYKKFGVYRENLSAISFSEGTEGMEKMKKIMELLRKTPPKTISNCEVVKIDDYLLKQSVDIKSEKISKLLLPKSNVLIFHLSDDSRLIIRPSGTEPKIKIYSGVSNNNPSENIEEDIALCDERLKALEHSFNQIIDI